MSTSNSCVVKGRASYDIERRIVMEVVALIAGCIALTAAIISLRASIIQRSNSQKDCE